MSTSELATAPGALDLRADFPILAREIDGHRLVYLDSSSTSQKPTAVLDALDDFYRNHNANIHRGVYPLAQEADALFEGARERIAAFVNWPADTTIFTKNVTEAINLVAHSWGARQPHPGRRGPDHARWSTTPTSCPGSSRPPPPARRCATSRSARTARSRSRSSTRELARGDVRMLALTHVSNVLGTINPVAEIVRRAHAAGALVLIDGAQAVPQLEVDLEEIGADFYGWTGHKALGPTGVGVLHGRRELLETMPPFLGGGDMIATVEDERSTWNELPWKFEAGTSMIAQVVGLGAAIDYLSAVGMANVRAHEQALTAYALERLAATGGVRVFGPPSSAQRGGVVSFALDGIHPHDVAELLGRRNVCVRASHHCAQPLMRTLGVTATARASFGPYNVAADVDALIDAIGDRPGDLRELMDDLYRDFILEHYKRPRNFGELPEHDHDAHEVNPLCGDELGVQIAVGEDGTIADLRFQGHGCAISQAAASMASEQLIGMPVDEVATLDADWMLELLGIDVSATRRKCALLSLKVVRHALTGDGSWP